ncbi:unnamed protein product [Caenorhabditis brenneri]
MDGQQFLTTVREVVCRVVNEEAMECIKTMIFASRGSMRRSEYPEEKRAAVNVPRHEILPTPEIRMGALPRGLGRNGLTSVLATVEEVVRREVVEEAWNCIKMVIFVSSGSMVSLSKSEERDG